MRDCWLDPLDNNISPKGWVIKQKQPCISFSQQKTYQKQDREVVRGCPNFCWMAQVKCVVALGKRL